MALTEIMERLNKLCEDRAVPSNVRRILREACDTLNNENEDLSLRVNTAVSLLDEASNDPNIAQFTRTEIWGIASLLETVK